MQDERKTKSQLIQELKAARKRIAEQDAPGDDRGAKKRKLRGGHEKRGNTPDEQGRDDFVKKSTLFQEIFENIPVGFVITNSKRDILHCNLAFSTMLGYPREELIGKHASEITYLDDEQENVALFTEALAKHNSGFQMEKRYIRKDGTILWGDLMLSFLYNRKGEPEFIVAMVQDITEQKMVGEALRIAQKRSDDEHARTDAILAAIGDGISILDADFKIVYQNQRLHDLIGDQVGEYCYAAYGQGDDVCDACPVAMVFSDGKVHTGERMIDSRRGVVHAEIAASPLRDAAGNIVAAVTAVRDITGRKQAADTLKLLKEAIESLPIGITIADLNGKIIYTNPAEADIHGYTELELIGKDARLLAPREKWDPVSFEQLHALGIRKRESINIRKNGEVFPVQLTSRAVKNADGVPIGIITACEDVTDRQQAEEKLRNAQRMEVIGKLAGGVAHEVRNPLNAIMAISDALAKDLGEDPEHQPFLGHIRVQVERLAMLMRDMLDLGKPAEQFQFQREALSDICSASLDIWRHSGSGPSHEIRMIQPPDAAAIGVRADSHRLQQVFVNLLQNATQHSPTGSEIQMVIHPPAGGSCTVHVVDRGSGVAPEFLPRIFEPFFSTRRGGTGLGMSIVKHIVETHGGTVEIMNNDPPPGCTVVVRLPEARKDEHEAGHSHC